MFSTMLYLRSQPLRVGDVYRLIVYPASSPYLATLTVTDQSSIKDRRRHLPGTQA